MSTPSERFTEREEIGHEMQQRIEADHRFGEGPRDLKPRWYRREDMPRVAGLWLSEYTGMDRRRARFVTDYYTIEDITRGAPFHCMFVYGPIPERERDGDA